MNHISPRSEIDKDVLFGGTVTLFQPRQGYRINADTLILAAFAARAHASRTLRVLDLGAGVGGATLALSRHIAPHQVALIERDSALAELARRNLSVSQLAGSVHTLDLATEALPSPLRGSANLVLANPPFFLPRQSRPPRNARRHKSRCGELAPFVRAAADGLGRRGAACFVYPAGALSGLLARAAASGLEAKRLRFVHAFSERPARIALVELRRGKPGGLVVEPPLFEWCRTGVRSAELNALSGPRPSDRKESRRQSVR